MRAAMASALVSAHQDRGARQRYRRFLDAVAASGTLWAVWRGDTWATADDPSGRNSALFLLWSSQESAEASLHASRAAFPGAAEVDRIALDKWLEAYTPELIERSPAPSSSRTSACAEPSSTRRTWPGTCGNGGKG